MKDLRCLFKLKHLEELNLSNNDVQDLNFPKICKVLKQCLPNLKVLKIKQKGQSSSAVLAECDKHLLREICPNIISCDFDKEEKLLITEKHFEAVDELQKTSTCQKQSAFASKKYCTSTFNLHVFERKPSTIKYCKIDITRDPTPVKTTKVNPENKKPFAFGMKERSKSIINLGPGLAKPDLLNNSIKVNKNDRSPLGGKLSLKCSASSKILPFGRCDISNYQTLPQKQ